MRDDRRQVRRTVERIMQCDPDLARELESKTRERREAAPPPPQPVPGAAAGPPGPEARADYATAAAPDFEAARRAVSILAGEGVPDSPEGFRRETIVLRAGRPVLAVQEGAPVLQFEDAESAVWNTRLENAAATLQRPIAAVGRIEVDNHPFFEWVGTGWLVDQDVVVTNRHVAEEFVTRGRGSLTFSTGFDRVNPIGCRIDLLEEIGRPQAQEFTISDALYVADDAGPDVAFFRLRPSRGGRPPLPVQLSSAVAPDGLFVATVGYPARDPRVPDQALMLRIYGDVFDKKRLAPGQVIRHERGLLLHDCTTLGGNSGSVVLDLRNGEAVALHFAGTYLRANFAVPATVLSQLLQDARRPRPIEVGIPTLTGPAAATPIGLAGSPAPIPGVVTSAGAGGIEVQVTVRVSPHGAQLPIAAAVPVQPGIAAAQPLMANPSRQDVLAAVEEARRTLGFRADVVNIRPGYRFREGWITDERVVVVGVRRKYEREELAARGLLPLPPSIAGVPLDVTTASDDVLLQQATTFGAMEARSWVSNYQPRPDLPLTGTERPLEFVCHAGPDAGWPQLQRFLGDVSEELVAGMYDFTAPHIVDAVREAVTPGAREMTLTLQRHASLTGATKANDIPEEETIADLQTRLDQRLTFSWASVTGPNRLFDSSYHIKVAVRDQEEFWLSSGSWQSSNQPPHDPFQQDTDPPLLRTYNREWHVVARNPELAKLFRAHLTRDADDAANVPEAVAAPEMPDLWVPIDYFYPTAPEIEAPPRYFPPLEGNRNVHVHPLLSPDNYAEEVLAVIQEAQEKIYFQNQSLSIKEEGSNTAKFEALLRALREKQDDGLEVRIIMRRIGDLREKLTLLKDYGFDMDQVRLQTNCHTKGLIVDSSVVVVGSHNWTNAGTAFNRDASLIFRDEAIARYYEELFLYDWRRSGRPRVDESVPAPRVARPDQELVPPPGMVRISWHEWFGE